MTLLLLTLVSATSALPAADPDARVYDSRSHELLSFQCASSAGKLKLTLFGNGTVRLREEGVDTRDEDVSLIELSEDELHGYVERLRSTPHDADARIDPGGPSGESVEQCRLEVDAAPGQQGSYRFSRMAGLPLDVSRLVRVAEELVDEVRARRLGAGFPPEYVPSPGDVLIARNGSRYRIERFTADGKGVEISGIDQPVVLYMETTAVVAEFAALEERESGR